MVTYRSLFSARTATALTVRWRCVQRDLASIDNHANTPCPPPCRAPRSHPWAARYRAQRTQCTAGLIAELDARLTERVPAGDMEGLPNFRAQAPGLPNAREIIERLPARSSQAIKRTETAYRFA